MSNILVVSTLPPNLSDFLLLNLVLRQTQIQPQVASSSALEASDNLSNLWAQMGEG